MCELLGVSSKVPATVRCGLNQLAAHSASGPHLDGWGIAYYAGTDVSTFRGETAAADDPRVRQLAARGLQTHLAVAHIRHATQGEVALRNTQPFTRQIDGRTHVFAHNGDLEGIDLLPRMSGSVCRPAGETDSEVAFCFLLDKILRLWSAGAEPPPLRDRVAALGDVAARLRELGPANFVYADGDALFAHGHRRKQAPRGIIMPPGLHVLSRSCTSDADDFDTQGLRISGDATCAVIVASVPLTDEPWEALEEGQLIAARGGRVVMRVRP